ncbi:MAG: TetR/AcrR family transcriptional regulator [Actinomycetota bacterium]|nr:TetR/AcrR family transcriptional regulator [Actinomycetota bacterium]
MPKISAPTLEQHRAGTIDRLLDAWSELVMQKGYAAVSLADIAAHAGLARTAIYNYFPDRESLLFAWTEREVARSIAILEQEIAEAPTSAEKLRSFVRLQLVDFASRHLPPGHEAMQFLKPETYDRFMQHIEPVERILQNILIEGAESGEFDGVDAAEMVPMIVACIGSERGPISSKTHTVEEAAERVTSFLLRALMSKAPDPAPKKRAAKPKAKA